MRDVVRAVMFDFGGVVTTSPFDAFAEYERRVGIEVGTIRSINARSSDTNAWALLERGELDVDGFNVAFEAEARAHGVDLDGAEVLACLRGRPRPRVVDAVRRCSAVLSTAIVTNNFVASPRFGTGPSDATFRELTGVVDAVVESARVGFRKPEPAFYEHALELLRACC